MISAKDRQHIKIGKCTHSNIENGKCTHNDEQIWPNKLNHRYFYFVILKLGSDKERENTN